MSKNIQNDETNESQTKSQKGYSLRQRNSSKKKCELHETQFRRRKR